MIPKVPDHLTNMIHPYVFLLKEGKAISENYLDYSLLMLQTTCPEVIPSPFKKHSENPLIKSAFNISSL
ncbi:hypothetical protein PHSC3_001873 [Chlamydiales bacterium STE3]|nr:hypothetical protein PHSC3_001873 [Chlamydiales bacterium STE3]